MNTSKYNKKEKKNIGVKAKVKSERLRLNFILGLILTYTFFLFAKSIDYQFVNWDDNSYIISNLLIRDFSFEGIKNIFSTPVIGMYNPLTFLVYAFEYHFWGMDPNVFHFFNIIIHLLATAAIFRFIYALTTRYETATIVALLFAIHPMHVPVVTWVSETKTALFVFFYAFALVYYIKYVKTNYQIKYLIFTGLLFLLGILSKPSAVTLPPMLLLIDYYLSRKFDKRVILEKLPFFAISIFFGILTILTHIEAADSIFDANNDYSLINNILISNYSVTFYINKIFIPLDLCTIYPYPENLALLPFKYYTSILTIPLVLWLVYKAGSFRKEMIFGLLYFIISISVVIRFVPSGFFRASNVYTYMSYTGLFFIVAQFITYILDNKLLYARKIKLYALLFLCSLVLFYTWRSTIRISVWENSITLFDDVILKRPKIALAYNNRGISKLEIGKVQEAMVDFKKAIELDPKYAVAYNNRGKVLVDMKDYDNALVDLNNAIRLDSDYAEAYINRGNIEFYREKYDQAMNDYNAAIRFNPKVDVVYRNRSKIKVIKKDDLGALKDLDKAIALNPNFAEAYFEKGNIMYNRSKFDEAVKYYSKTIQINPKDVDAYNNRSLAKTMLHDTEGAREDAEKATILKNSAKMQSD